MDRNEGILNEIERKLTWSWQKWAAFCDLMAEKAEQEGRMDDARWERQGANVFREAAELEAAGKELNGSHADCDSRAS
jgi:hypothetical protein